MNDSLVAADELYSIELKYKEQQQQEKKEQEQAENKRLEYVKKGFLGEYKHRFLVREDGTVFIDNPNGWSEVCSSLKEAIKKHGPVVKEDM